METIYSNNGFYGKLVKDTIDNTTSPEVLNWKKLNERMYGLMHEYEALLFVIQEQKTIEVLREEEKESHIEFFHLNK